MKCVVMTLCDNLMLSLACMSYLYMEIEHAQKITPLIFNAGTATQFTISC